MHSKRFSIIMAAIGLAILLFVLKGLDFDYLKTFHFSLTFANVFMLILLVFAIFAVRTARWICYLKSIGIKIGFRDAYFVVVPSIAFGLFTPAQTGDLLKIEMLKRQKNIKRRESLATVLVEKAADFFLIFIVFLFAVFHFSLKLLNINYKIVILTAALFLIFSFFFILYFKKNIIIKNTIKNTIKIISDFKSFSLAVILTVIYWGLTGLIWYFVAKVANINLSFFLLFGILSVITVISLITLIPGALGIMEFSTIFMLTTFAAVSANQAAVFALSYRVYSILIFIVAYLHIFAVRKQS